MATRKRKTPDSPPTEAGDNKSSHAAPAPDNPGGIRGRAAWDPFDAVKALDSIGAHVPFEAQIGDESVVCVVSQHGQVFRREGMRLVTAPVTGWRQLSKRRVEQPGSSSDS